MLDLSLTNPGRYSGVGVRSLRPWLVGLVEEIAPQSDSLAVVLTSDSRMRQVNRDFRNRDQSTDVLSFPGEEGPEGFHLGDICISIPTARRQAFRAGHSLARELRVLALHGVLHCLGYDHETDDGEMEVLELGLRGRWIDRSFGESE